MISFAFFTSLDIICVETYRMTRILKLNNHNPKKEMEFELKFLKSLSVKQRFALMFKKTREIIDLLEKGGHRRSFKIIKRTEG